MLDRRQWFIREHVGMLKLTDTYDILDPESGAVLGIAKERPGALVHVLRFVMKKGALPTRVEVFAGPEPDGSPVFTIKRGLTFIRSKVDILDGTGRLLGWFKQKALSIGGSFRVFDANGNQVATVKGNWKGFTFRFIDDQEQEVGVVSKQWSGLGKELFTTADNYMIDIHGDPSPAKATLLLAAGLAIDTIFKERNG
ncbi:MAG: phospholipid scramblase-related protein [Planctomycetota bacterium]